MTDQTAVDELGSKHNEPPSDQVILENKIAEDHHALVTRKNQLLTAAREVPKEIGVDDEDLSKDVTDQIRQLRDHRIKVGKVRVDVKEPFLMGTRVVDGFFKGIVDPIENAEKALNGRLTKYQRAVAAKVEEERLAEQRKAEEEARKLRVRAEEAELALLEAKRVAEEERLKREAAEKKAEDDRIEAERLRENARIRDEEAAKKAREDGEEAAMPAPQPLPPQRRAPPPAPIRRTESAVDETVAAAAAAVEVTRKHAAAAQGDVVRATASAQARAADMSRQRTDRGAVASLSSKWIHDEASLNRETIDLEALRQHLGEEALNKAVRSWIKAQDTATLKGDSLTGVFIFVDTKTRVR